MDLGDCLPWINQACGSDAWMWHFSAVLKNIRMYKNHTCSSLLKDTQNDDPSHTALKDALTKN